MTGQITTIPRANRTIVEGELRRALRQAARRKERYGPHAGSERLLLLRAAPEWRGPEEFTVDSGDGPAVATVRGCATVLAVLDALASTDPATEQASGARPSYLVVLTPCEDDELGRSVLAQALGNEVRSVNRWDLVAEAFGARKLDPRLNGKGYRWLAEALLDAQPGTTGWRRLSGPVLQLDTAMQRLASVRFGREGESLDAAALLEWSRDPIQVTRFLSLRAEERAGLTAWLEESVGPVARVMFQLLGQNQAADAVAFGLAAAELYAPGAKRRQVVVEARIRAEMRFLGGNAPPEANLRSFAEAAESLTLRWSDNGHALDAHAACARAEQILAELHAGELAGGSRVLEAGLDARLSTLAEEIAAALPLPRAADLPPVEEGLDRLREHRRPGDRAAEVEAAVAAVRLVRWLIADEPTPATVADGASRQVRSWGWADRATALIWNPDTARVPRAQAAYAMLYDAVRERRAAVDRAFAERLAEWSTVAGDTERLLLAENLLDRIARPVAERAAPMIVVVDGMSTAVACELAQEITAGRTWHEVGRGADGREPALATLPSTTRFSRTSLLCGTLKDGGQQEERAGFAVFWRGRRSTLFHKAGLSAGAGARLHPDVETAIKETTTVVGVVLNTIDERLRDDGQVSDQTWRVADVDYLPELMRAAAAAGRPVILTSDHGHVLDHGDDIHRATGETARYRTGTPGEGELAFRGPRVLLPGGTVTMPWDERIRYLPRKAGYHGGASTAEMVIPVLVFVPSPSLRPKGWALHENPSLHEPPWWSSSPKIRTVTPAKKPRKIVKRPEARENVLFGTEEIAAEPGLGAPVVASEIFAGQRSFVRKAPDDTVVAALIDGLVRAGGKLPLQAAADLIGQPAFRMPGYLVQIGRLLNLDGYQIISTGDGGRTVELNIELLRTQFLGGG